MKRAESDHTSTALNRYRDGKTRTVRPSTAGGGNMPAYELGQPFDSIESAQDFMQILAETILETMTDLNRDHQAAMKDSQERRAQAIELAIFKLKTLNCHVHKSRRVLNDLRMIRRLILNERLPIERVIATL
jgi:hypothetical protein